MKTAIAALSLGASFVLGACATSSNQVSTNYVSPLKYSSYSCQDIEYEMREIESRVNQLTGQQDQKARNDRIATGVGVVLFWPALFFLASDDVKNELATAKGEYEALEEAARRKECFRNEPE
ncbi:MAG: hypothetical protein AAF253_03810 [Pseudomonadota bacterium]